MGYTPPPPMVSPLACQVGSCFFWACCFSRLVLFGLVPSPPVEWDLWSFWLAPPRLWGAVCSTEVWYGCCHLLVAMSSLRARYHTKYDVALSSLQTVRPVPALMRFSAPVKKHWLGSFSVVLPRSGLRGFVPGRGGGIPWGGGGGARDPRAYNPDLAPPRLSPKPLNPKPWLPHKLI